MTKLKGRQKAKARKQKRITVAASKQSYKKQMLSKILKYDNEALKKKCVDVAVGTNVSETIKTMKKVLGCTENGVGLAASQIGILDRIILIKPDARKTKITVMINPEIISHSEEKKYGIEGCLSYPKTYAPVERYAWVEVKYFAPVEKTSPGANGGKYYDGSWEERTFKSKPGTIDGIAIQHEIEHLDEGHCQIHDWWDDMEGKQKELQEIFENKGKPEEIVSSNNDVVESEDLKREKAEALASEVVEDIETLAEAIESGEDITTKTI